MTFDKSKVYTALNADELPIGSKCIFADTVRKLQKKVEQKNNTNCIETFYKLRNRGGDDLFVGKDCKYCYAYLIEPPAEPRYEAFESIESAMEAIKAHGGWVKDMISNRCYAIVAYDEATVETEQDTFGVDALFDGFIFADDCTPCGKLVEER